MNYLEKNLEVIKQLNKDTYNKIKDAEPPAWFEKIYSENGMENFLIKNGGRVFPAYDIKNPKKELKLFKYYDGGDDSVTIGIGLGMAHTLDALLSRISDKHLVLIIEPVPYIAKMAFENYDFSEKMKENKVFFIISDEKKDIANGIAFLENINVVHNWHTMIEKYTVLRPDEYNDIVKYVIEIINQINCNNGTMEGAGYRIAMNDIANLPYVIRHRGVNELKDFYKNKPCVIVSTGPSLQKNIHILKKYQDKVIIIAVAQALRVLLAYDIIPDFIGTVDYGEVNEEHFKGLWDADVPLVALNRSYAPILKKWQGSKFIAVSFVIGKEGSVIHKLQKKGFLEQGGSVSHFCFGLGLTLGCDPIIIMGQDLAYEGEQSHIPLVDAGGAIQKNEDGTMEWVIKDPRSSLKSNKEYKGKYSMGGQVWVDGYFGDKVPTNVGLASFLTSFEGIIANYKDRIFINSTEGGARIKGCDHIFLQDAIDKYCKKSINKTSINKILSYERGWLSNMKDIMVPLYSDLKILRECKEYSEKALEINKKLKKENAKKRRNRKMIDELLKDNEEHSKQAHEKAKESSLLGLYIYKESRALNSKKYTIKRDVKKELFNYKDALNIRIDRNKMILEGAIKGCNELIKLYEETIGIMEKYLETRDDNILLEKTKIEVDLDDVDKYFEVGNWGHPYVDAKRVIENSRDYDEKTVKLAKEIYIKAKDMRDKKITEMENKEEKRELLEYNKMVESALKEGKEKKFDKALYFLKKASEIKPDEIYALWGLATTYHHINEIDNSLKYYEKIIEKDPENKRFKFEYGNVLLRKDVNQGIKKIREVMDGTEEFDSFLVNIGKLYLSQGMYREAEAVLEEYVNKFPYNVQALIDLKVCYDFNKKERDSIAIQQKINKLLNTKNASWSICSKI